jgi:hypothetical protein
MRKLILLTTLLSSSGFATSIDFQQGGWSLGSALRVSFTGIDNNFDGILINEELTRFRAVWETPSGTFTEWGLTHIEPAGFKFTDLGNFLLFTRNSEYSLVNTAFEGESFANVFDSQFLLPVDSTSSPAHAAPEPGTFGLLATLGATLLIRKKLRRLRATGVQ